MTEIVEIENNEFEYVDVIDTRDVVIQDVPIYPDLTNIEINPSKNKQVFNHEGSYGYDEVVVNAIELQDKEVSASKELQTIVADEEYSGLNEVTINPVTNEIDENIKAENIKSGVNILGVEGNFVGSKYAPRHLTFRNYKGSDLDYEIQNLDIKNMTSLNEMFYMSSVQNLDLSSWDTSNITSLYGFAYACTSLATINLTGWNTSKVTDFRSAFYNTNLVELDISSFTSESCTSGIYRMFKSSSKLTRIDMRNFDIPPGSNNGGAFDGIPVDCLIIVKNDTVKQWVLSLRTDLTNVKTVEELG